MFLSEISYRKCIHLLQEVGVQFSFEFGLNSFRVDFSAGFKACILQPGAQPNFLSYTAEWMQVDAELVVDEIQLNMLKEAYD